MSQHVGMRCRFDPLQIGQTLLTGDGDVPWENKTKFGRMTKRAENGDARMRNELSKADNHLMLERPQGLKDELESLGLWAAADEAGAAINLVRRRKSY